MQSIDREQLKQKLDRGEPFKLIEVLSPDAYADYHLPAHEARPA